VETSLDEATRDVLDLLAGLDKEVVAGRDLHRNAVAGVTGPDVEAGVAGAAVDGEEIEVGMEAGEDGVFGAILDEVGSGGSKKVRTAKMITLVSILCSRRLLSVLTRISQHW
jgi:hypothetical protein